LTKDYRSTAGGENLDIKATLAEELTDELSAFFKSPVLGGDAGLGAESRKFSEIVGEMFA
jgi:hypothetical protein